MKAKTNVKQANKIRSVVTKNTKQDEKIQNIERHLTSFEERLKHLETPVSIITPKEYKDYSSTIIIICGIIMMGFLFWRVYP